MNYFHDINLFIWDYECPCAIPKQHFFLWVAASVADAAAVNLNDIKTFLAYDLSTFLIKGNQAFSDGPNNPHENLHDNPPDFPMQSSSW